MRSKKAKEIRKASQYETRQITEIFKQVMDQQLAMPFKTRWRMALKILIGKRKCET